MFVEILLAILIGILAGIFTGMIPGVHVNLVTSIIVTISFVQPLLLSYFIISMALTHSFLDSIPSLYLGAPDPTYALSVLPGHQLLHEGKGYQAIVYTLIGSFLALGVTLMIFPFGVWYLPNVSYFLSPYIGYILLAVVLFLFYYSGSFVKNAAFFLAAGGLGFLVFALPSQEQVLLPLLSGLFGTSTLLFSLLSVTSLPEQNVTQVTRVSAKDIDDCVGRASIMGVIAAFLPGFGSSQGAICALATMKKPQPHHYLLLTGALNTVAFAFSLVTFATLGKARNGAIVGVGELLGAIAQESLWMYGAQLLFVGGVATLVGLWLAKKSIIVLQQLPYKQLVYGLLLFLILLIFWLSGAQGMIIALAATGLGLLSQFYGAQRNMLLGCLLLPVLTYFL